VHAWLLWSAVGVGKRGKRESAGKRRKRGKSARSEAKNRGKQPSSGPDYRDLARRSQSFRGPGRLPRLV